MIKKIQQYLLLHYPILWNTKLVPMLLAMALMHIVAYFIGYVSTKTVFVEYYRYSDTGILYLTSFLISLFSLIIWLIYYNKNNATKSYYPRTTLGMYTEWLIALTICCSIATITVSSMMGAKDKWRANISKESAQKNLDLLNKMALFTLQDKESYTFNNYIHKPIYPSTAVDTAQSADAAYTGQSLLFFNNGQFDYEKLDRIQDEEYSIYEIEEIEKNKKHIDAAESSKRLLVNNERDSILALITDFSNLLASHQIEIYFLPEQWLENVYNPPYFPVTDLMLKDRHYTNYTPKGKRDQRLATDCADLVRSYEGIVDSYGYSSDRYEDECTALLVCIYIALGVSLLIFSYRLTKLRSWMTALIAMAIMCFVFGLLVAILGLGVGGFLTLWLMVTSATLYSVLSRVSRNKSQGRGKVLINMVSWLILPILPLIIASISSIYTYDEEGTINQLIRWIDRHNELLLWLHIPFLIVIMYPISVLMRKFKGLPDE